MLKNFRLIATVFVVVGSGIGAFAQTNETEEYKDVLLNGKPALLNLVTGEVTYANGELAKSRAAKKMKDSLLATRTEIKTNLIKDMVTDTDESTQSLVLNDSIHKELDAVKEDVEIANVESTQQNLNSSQQRTDYVTLVSQSNSEINNDTTEANSSDFHLVKKGETLYALSKRFNTTLGELMLANDLETTLIKEGETLRVRNFESDNKVAETVWIVSKGDTLYNIAKRNNTTVEDLKTLNDLSDNLIKVGQKLQVNQNSILSKK